MKCPLDGTKLTDTATTNGLQVEEPNELWETALAQSTLEGGDEKQAQERAVKIYRGLKKKLKAQVKKQALIAV